MELSVLFNYVPAIYDKVTSRAARPTGPRNRYKLLIPGITSTYIFREILPWRKIPMICSRGNARNLPNASITSSKYSDP
jgi:hypothetical protein